MRCRKLRIGKTAETITLITTAVLLFIGLSSFGIYYFTSHNDMVTIDRLELELELLIDDSVENALNRFVQAGFSTNNDSLKAYNTKNWQTYWVCNADFPPIFNSSNLCSSNPSEPYNCYPKEGVLTLYDLLSVSIKQDIENYISNIGQNKINVGDINISITSISNSSITLEFSSFLVDIQNNEELVTIDYSKTFSFSHRLYFLSTLMNDLFTELDENIFQYINDDLMPQNCTYKRNFGKFVNNSVSVYYDSWDKDMLEDQITNDNTEQELKEDLILRYTSFIQNWINTNNYEQDINCSINITSFDFKFNYSRVISEVNWVDSSTYINVKNLPSNISYPVGASNSYQINKDVLCAFESFRNTSDSHDLRLLSDSNFFTIDISPSLPVTPDDFNESKCYVERYAVVPKVSFRAVLSCKDLQKVSSTSDFNDINMNIFYEVARNCSLINETEYFLNHYSSEFDFTDVCGAGTGPPDPKLDCSCPPPDSDPSICPEDCEVNELISCTPIYNSSGINIIDYLCEYDCVPDLTQEIEATLNEIQTACESTWSLPSDFPSTLENDFAECYNLVCGIGGNPSCNFEGGYQTYDQISPVADFYSVCNLDSTGFNSSTNKYKMCLKLQCVDTFGFNCVYRSHSLNINTPDETIAETVCGVTFDSDGFTTDDKYKKCFDLDCETDGSLSCDSVTGTLSLSDSQKQHIFDHFSYTYDFRCVDISCNADQTLNIESLTASISNFAACNRYNCKLPSCDNGVLVCENIDGEYPYSNYPCRSCDEGVRVNAAQGTLCGTGSGSCVKQCDSSGSCVNPPNPSDCQTNNCFTKYCNHNECQEVPRWIADLEECCVFNNGVMMICPLGYCDRTNYCCLEITPGPEN